MPGPELHPALAELAPLLGRWEGAGRGWFPTIDDFDYTEVTTFGHAGKPFLALTQATRSPEGAPLHAESGYLRAVGDGRLELVMAHPFGAAELAEGHAVRHGDHLRIELATTAVVLTATAKEVTEVRRELVVDGDELRYRVAMAAVGRPLQDHLEATLHRSR